MAIHAFDDYLLPEVQRKLALCFEYFALVGLSIDETITLFLNSDYASAFEEVDPFMISGKSSIEICLDMLGKEEKEEIILPDSLSPEYWLGYYLVYYQWKTRLSYRDIFKNVKPHDLLSAYHPYHEMDPEHFCDYLDSLLGREKHPLKAIRLKAKLSQSDLACLSGVPLRSIQQYEQGRKELSKASFETVYALSKALRVSPIELV